MTYFQRNDFITKIYANTQFHAKSIAFAKKEVFIKQYMLYILFVVDNVRFSK